VGVEAVRLGVRSEPSDRRLHVGDLTVFDRGGGRRLSEADFPGSVLNGTSVSPAITASR